VLNLSIGSLYDRQECLSPATSTNDQQTVNPIDSALTLTGTWLDV
jgi:hypothetical protein